MDVERGCGLMGGWLCLVFTSSWGKGVVAHAVPPDLQDDVLADIAARYGADVAATIDRNRCRIGESHYLLDLGGMAFQDGPMFDVPLSGGRTLRIWKHQGRAVLDLMRSLADPSNHRIGASGVPWVKAKGFHHCCVLRTDEVSAVVDMLISCGGKLAALEADHAACVRACLDAANRRYPGGEA